ncbi:electron transfer flavoprotein beta subunit lysine methyltransferase [Thalassophryne amazonica]|uniref:electron transfer flavoprotein beta subunit lysine methyltransferase n=1 Tax=Thalassophryne amazonica TaxID=390379 RepID=UPI001471BB08|nr:electron transfer flavoprotein beta subunit lysine methyltransferase [Thalassophryne amazonica]
MRSLDFLTSRVFSRYIKTYFKVFKQTNSWRCFSDRRESDKSIRTFIKQNTEIVGEQSLTPAIKLRLFTPNCRFWTERPELWPFRDPYWAIYWPGGQALSRYLLDNPEVCCNKSVLDLGSGCGASAIAAQLCGAAHVVANDIDCVAAIATHMNCEVNSLELLDCVTGNVIDSEPKGFDLILLGDMFYDNILATSLHRWLDCCIRTQGTQVLIGDPGRTQFDGQGIRRFLQLLARFELPELVREENYGLTDSTVWCYQPEM